MEVLCSASAIVAVQTVDKKAHRAGVELNGSLVDALG